MRDSRSNTPAAGGPQPGAFSLGSPQSRAAARALLDAKVRDCRKLDFVLTVAGDRNKNFPPQVGKWDFSSDGATATRFSRIPNWMTLEDAVAYVANQGAAVSAARARK